MILSINGKTLEVANHMNADELITELGYQNQRIALEVNQSIVPKSQHGRFTFNEGDRVEIIKAVGGG